MANEFDMEAYLDTKLLGMEICHFHSKASKENVDPARRGDYDAEYMNTALAVEKLFLKRGWTPPLPKPEKPNYVEENKPENGCVKCGCPKYAQHAKKRGNVQKNKLKIFLNLKGNKLSELIYTIFCYTTSR